MSSDQMERLVYNWSMENPGQMWLYDPEDAAHEFNHQLKLGDAYNAPYRGNYEADKEFQMKNDYGEDATYKVPDKSKTPNVESDIMRGRYKGPNRVSDATVMLLANQIWRKGTPYYHDKDTYKK